MGLLTQIEQDMKQALKAKETLKLETLKTVKSDIMYEKAKTGEEVPEEKVLEIVTRAAKRRKESATEFTKGGREELAEKEIQELAIIETYLPAQMSDEEIAAVIDKTISDMGATGKQDFGKVMGPIMAQLKGKADGAVVKKILTEKLS